MHIATILIFVAISAISRVEAGWPEFFAAFDTVAKIIVAEVEEPSPIPDAELDKYIETAKTTGVAAGAAIKAGADAAIETGNIYVKVILTKEMTKEILSTKFVGLVWSQFWERLFYMKVHPQVPALANNEVAHAAMIVALQEMARFLNDGCCKFRTVIERTVVPALAKSLCVIL